MKKLYNDTPFMNKKKGESTEELQQQVGLLESSLASIATNVESFPIQVPEVDDTARIQRALDAAASSNRYKVIMPKTSYNVSGSITIPLGVKHLDGTGAIINVPKDNAFDVLVITDGQNQKVSNLSIVESNYAFKQRTTGKGVLIQGNSVDIVIENVNTVGCQSGFGIVAGTGFTCERIAFRNCKAEYSSQYGFVLDDVNVVSLDTCYAYRNWLDGFKLRKRTKNVSIRYGESSYNGENGSNGNGLDGYAGGENFVIDGFICENNVGSGIYIKSGDLNDNSGELSGHIRNFQISNVQCRYNTNNGLDLNRNSGSVDTDPLVNFVNIIGGVFEENDSNGILIRGRNVNINSPLIRKNKKSGLVITTGYSVNITSPIINSNGILNDAGNYYGVELTGKRIKILGGVINGAEADYLAVDADYSFTTWVASTAYTLGQYVRNGKNIYKCTVAGTSGSTAPTHTTGTAVDGTVTWEYTYAIYHYAPILVSGVSDEVLIRDVSFLNWHSGNQSVLNVSNQISQGNIVIHYGKMGTTSTYGSQGSTLTNNGNLFTKTTDITVMTGWKNISNIFNEGSGLATFSGTGSATAFTIAHGLPSQPNKVMVIPRTANAAGSYYVNVDNANITITYLTAPPSGTNNLQLWWRAAV